MILVEAPEALQIARISARACTTPELAKAMVATQLSFAERLPMADDVLINDDSLVLLEDWTERLHRRYLRMA